MCSFERLQLSSFPGEAAAGSPLKASQKQHLYNTYNAYGCLVFTQTYYYEYALYIKIEVPAPES
jgi:hypothetical protein